jgi:elongation factor Ts
MVTPFNRSIHAYVHQGRIGVLVELGSETHIVTTNPQFLEVAQGIAMHIASQAPIDTEALLAQRYAKDSGVTVAQVVSEASKGLGESISITRFIRWDQELGERPQLPTPPRSPAAVMPFRR